MPYKEREQKRTNILTLLARVGLDLTNYGLWFGEERAAKWRKYWGQEIRKWMNKKTVAEWVRPWQLLVSSQWFANNGLNLLEEVNEKSVFMCVYGVV